MKNKKYFVKSTLSNKNSSTSYVETDITMATKPTQELLSYYKNKVMRMEKEFDELSKMVDKLKTASDLNHETQRELNLRNEEVSKLQTAISDLQVSLFREREENLRLAAENDSYRIKECEDKKKIDILLQLSGATQNDLLYFVTDHPKAFVVPQKLPPRLQKLRDSVRDKMFTKLSPTSAESSSVDVQNHSLTAQLEQQMKLSKEEVAALLKDRELILEERFIERQRLNKEISKLTTQLKHSQDELCEATGKVIQLKKELEAGETSWTEEKVKYVKAIKVLSDQSEEGVQSEALGYTISGVGSTRRKSCGELDMLRVQLNEKDQLASLYQEQALALEAEINRLKEQSESCKIIFKDKTQKMTAQVAYLKNKYDDLDRRRVLEAEGFRTDIRMLRQRVKELEKKLIKANTASSNVSDEPSETQLLASVKNTLNRAKQLEKELSNIKNKIAVLERSRDRS